MEVTNQSSHTAILKRVGIALILVGVIDIAVMIYCIANRIGYSSSFNVFAVVAGIFLYRGGIKAAKFVTAAAAFFLAVFGCLFILLLMAIALQEFTVTSFTWYVVFPAAVLYFLYWTYSQLRLEPVLQARRDAGLTDSPPKLAFALGLALLPLTAVMMFAMLSRDGPFKDLSAQFPIDSSIASPEQLVASSMTLTSNSHPGAFSYNGVIRLYLSSDAVEIQPTFPVSLAMHDIQVPLQSISGCSKTCGGWWTADLLIASTGTKISVPESQSILDWCWTRKIPMVSGKDKREWLYNGADLPDAYNYVEQLASRDAYDEQTKLSCQGY